MQKTFSPRRARPLPAFVWATLALGALFAASGSAAAQGLMPVPRDNVVSFSTAATAEVTRDLLTVVLTATKDGSDAKTVQTGLKQMLDAALTEARAAAAPEAMEVRTGQFSIQPRYGRDGRINGWQGTAELILEGTDGARVAQTAGRLSSLNITRVGYSLSRKLREKYESAVTADAVARFRARAAEIAKSFGFAGYTLGEISVNSGEPAYEMKQVMHVRAMAAGASEDAALPVEPGKGTITVSVSGSIVLQR